MFVCFVDFKKAYDLVWGDGLFYKLIKISFSSKFVKTIIWGKIYKMSQIKSFFKRVLGGGQKVVEIFTFNDAPQKIRVTSFYRIKKYSFFAILVFSPYI